MIGGIQQQVEIMSVENVVAKDQGRQIIAYELLADEKRLGQTVGRFLHGILKVEAPLLPSPSSCSNRGVSWGVEIIRMSWMPASISVLLSG